MTECPSMLQVRSKMRRKYVSLDLKNKFKRILIKESGELRTAYCSQLYAPVLNNESRSGNELF